MSIFVSDSFTETSDVTVNNHTGETGATWTSHPSYTSNLVTVDAATDRIYPTGDPQCFYASGIPPSADYYVKVDVFAHTNTATNIGPALRIDTSANTMYLVRYRDGIDWQLRKLVTGTASTLGTPSTNQLIGLGAFKTVKLVASGTSLSVYVNDVLEIGPVTDSDISAAGRAGFRSAGGVTSTTGFHLDNLEAGDLVVATGISVNFPKRSLRPAIFKPGLAR